MGPYKTLTRIQGTGIKNWKNIDLVVDPLTILAGFNGCGKSAALESIRLSVLGYEPSLGKQLLQVRTQLANGTDVVETGLVFNDGFAIKRSFGAEKKTAVAPPKRERTEAHMQERINDELGGFVLSMDIRELTALTAEKRREYVFGLLPRERAQLTEEQFRQALGYAEHQLPVQRAIDKLWVEHVLKGETAVEGLASAIDHANRHTLEAIETRLKKASHLEELQRDLTTAIREAEGGGYDQALVERLQGELETAERELAETVEYNRTARERHDQQKREFQRKVDAIAKEARVSERLQRTRAHSDSLREQLKKLPEETDEASLEERLTAAKAVLQTALNEEVEAVNQYDESRATFMAKKSELAKSSSLLQEIEKADECPFCGGKADLERYREQIRQEVQDLEREALLAEKALQIDEEVTRNARAKRTAADEQVREAKEALLNLQRIRSHREDVTANLQRADQDLVEIERDLTDVRKEIEALAAVEDPGTLNLQDTTEHTTRIADLKVRIRAEQAKAVSGAAPETIRSQIAEAEKELVRAEAREKALKDLHKRLQVLRGEVIRGMLAPVERTAKEILRQIFPTREFSFQYDREGREVLDWGFTEDDAFRSFSAASNGEAAVLVTVLLAALMDDLKPAWRVLLLDNAEALDDDPRTETRRRFMEAIAKIRDRFDNVILAACGKSALEPVPGWKVIDMAEVTGAVQRVKKAAAA